MAQKRMIDKKISVSEQVSNLPLPAQLIFTWSIVHADDLGLLPASMRTLRAMVIPMLDMSLEEFEGHMEKIIKSGLFEKFEHEGDKYFKISTFHNHQTLKRDRKPNTILKNIEDWKTLETIGIQLEDNGIQMEDIGNPSEVKGSRVKGTEVITPTAISPVVINKDFFDRGTTYHSLLKEYGEKLDVGLVDLEFKKFILYWTEPNKSGTKVRWQQQNTFDVERRLMNWFNNVRDRRKTTGRGLA